MVTETITSVPMLDLNAQYEPIKDEVLAAMKDVFESKQFIQGPKVVELEQQIAQYCGAKEAIGVSSGTDALVLALMALEIGPGDEVITTPFTFFATGGSIARVGATPVFIDIDPETYNIDPNLIEDAITDNTKAIMPVHLFGQMADMDPILAIAKKYELFVIEDSAQAIGSSYQSEDGNMYKAGTMGTVGCFSFFPSKNLGACGDGGIVTTQDPELAEKLRCMRTHGAQKKYFHDMVGGNFRLDPLQAAILLVKLPHLDAQHQGRRDNAAYYDANLSDAIGKPVVAEKMTTIYNQYTIRTANRDAIQKALNEAKIGNAVYYPVPLHLQNCFANLGYSEGDLPHAELATKEVVSIPVYPELSDAQKDYIVSVINAA